MPGTPYSFGTEEYTPIEIRMAQPYIPDTDGDSEPCPANNTEHYEF